MSVALRDWLAADLLVELSHTKPMLAERKGDDDSVNLEVVLKDGLPVMETNVIGVMRLELSELLTNVDLQVKDTDYHVKVPFFDPALSHDRSEFKFRNQMI